MIIFSQTMKVYVIIVVTLLVLLTCGEKEEMVARVGSKIIFSEELQNRADFTPEYRYRGPESGRAAYLLELIINEKLAALAAESLKLDTTATIRNLTTFIEEMALARELYRKKIQSRVRIPKKQIDLAVQQQAQTRVIAYLAFRDEAMAKQYRQRLAEGLSFADAMREIYGLAVDTSGNRREIRWGYNDQAIEEAVFALQRGEVSEIVSVAGAYMVMVLEDIKIDPIVTHSELARRKSYAHRVLRARQEAQWSDDYIRQLAKDKRLQFNKPLIKLLADYLAEKTIMDTGEKEFPQLKFRPLADAIYRDANDYLYNHLQVPMVTFTGGSLSLEEILRRWRAYNFPVDLRSRQACASSIVRSIGLMVRDELLAREARRMGLGNSPRVQNEIRMWKDYYLCTLWFHHQKEMASQADKSIKPQLMLLRKMHPVTVDSMVLKKVEPSPIPLLALRVGQYNGLVVPPFTYFD